MYRIIIFDEDNSIAGVPSTWIKKIEDKIMCYWPLVSSRERVEKIIREQLEPNASWQLYNCRTKGGSISLYSDLGYNLKEAETISAQLEDVVCAIMFAVKSRLRKKTLPAGQPVATDSESEQSSLVSPPPPAPLPRKKLRGWFI